MCRRKKRLVSVIAVLGVLGVLSLFLILGSGGEAQQEEPQVAAITQVGRFIVGSQLGEERAGFSGLPKVQIFADFSAPDWPELKAILESPAVTEEVLSFTPVLVDAKDPEEGYAEARARQNGFECVIRGLNGKFLGGLPRGFSAADLVGLLRTLRETRVFTPQRSPIYTLLLNSPDAIDRVIQAGDIERAEELLERLREFEGEASPVVTFIEARLGL